MPNYRNTAAVGQDQGSSYMALIEHDSDYAFTGELIFLQVIQDSDLVRSVATLTKENEEGTVYSSDGATTLTKNFTVMQKSLDAYRLPKLLGTSTYAWVKEMSRVADTNGDYIYEIGIGATISKNQTITGKSGSIPFTLNVSPNDVDVTFALASFDDAKWKGDLGAASAYVVSADDGADYVAVSPA